jgi:hypothetical protein
VEGVPWSAASLVLESCVVDSPVEAGDCRLAPGAPGADALERKRDISKRCLGNVHQFGLWKLFKLWGWSERLTRQIGERLLRGVSRMSGGTLCFLHTFHI